MKKPFLIPKFDPRLRAELHAQRKTIGTGLFCVVVAALLSALLVPLIGAAVDAVQDAAPAIQQQSIAPEAETGNLWDRVRGVFTRERPATPTNLPPGNAEAVARLGVLCLGVVGLFGLRYWFVRGQTYYLSKASARMAIDLRLRLFRKLQKLPVSYFNEKRAGAIQSVLTNDVNVYQNAVMVVRDSIDGPVRAIGAFLMIILIQWQLALVSILFVPVMVAVISRNARRMRGAQAAVQDDVSELSAMSTEAVQGTRVIRAFGAEELVQGAYSKLAERSYRSQIRAAKILSSLRPLVELIGAGALAAVLYICGWLAYYGRLQLGDVAALIYSLELINQGFRSLSSVSSTYAQVQAASNRIYEQLLDVHEPHDSDAGTTIENPQGRVEFRDVFFTYPDGTEALSGVSFTIEPGSSLALVGPSGAGKSTIADLMLRFYEPSQGQILVDGVDIRELKLSWLRSQIGVVPQQTFLFAGSIAENIRLGDEHATDEEVRNSAIAAHALEFIDTMPAKFESDIGESGNRLSGGQRQRVAIARALVRKPTLLLLDEATSALDPTSEKVVTEALGEIMKTRTTLFIAHRLTTAARADRILVLRRGEAVEIGSHRELMDQGGVYSGLFQAFSGGVLE